MKHQIKLTYIDFISGVKEKFLDHFLVSKEEQIKFKLENNEIHDVVIGTTSRILSYRFKSEIFINGDYV